MAIIDAIRSIQRTYRSYKYNKRFIRSQRNEVNRIHARQREYLSRFENPEDEVFFVTSLPIFPQVTSQNFICVKFPERSHAILRHFTPLSIGNFMACVLSCPLFDNHIKLKKVQNV